MAEGPSPYAKIRESVLQIPAGRVATYGQIARLSGLGKRARMVGHALRHTPEHIDIPWHRVINARGRISFPPDSEHYHRQRELLISEGVPFVGERIDLQRCRWRPGLEDVPDCYFVD